MEIRSFHLFRCRWEGGQSLPFLDRLVVALGFQGLKNGLGDDV